MNQDQKKTDGPTPKKRDKTPGPPRKLKPTFVYDLDLADLELAKYCYENDEDYDVPVVIQDGEEVVSTPYQTHLRYIADEVLKKPVETALDKWRRETTAEVYDRDVKATREKLAAKIAAGQQAAAEAQRELASLDEEGMHEDES